jgi:Transposase IS66 family/Family of unknown function (DUF6444)
VCQLIIQLLAVIQQQAVRIAALEARLSQTSRNSDRPPSSDPPFVTRPSSSTTQRTPYRYGYGPRFTALIRELSGSQRDSRSAMQEFCRSVLGVPISRGAIQRVVDRVSEAITPYDEAIAEKARGVPVNYIDETAWYQHVVLAWLWVMVNPTVAFFMVHASRSQAAFEALVQRWAGILVSDGYAVYR